MDTSKRRASVCPYAPIATETVIADIGCAKLQQYNLHEPILQLKLSWLPQGVDANRNWGFHWNEGGSSYDKCSDTYHGPEAFSEVSLCQRWDTIGTIFALLILTPSTWIQMYWLSNKGLPKEIFWHIIKLAPLQVLFCWYDLNGFIFFLVEAFLSFF